MPSLLGRWGGRGVSQPWRRMQGSPGTSSERPRRSVARTDSLRRRRLRLGSALAVLVVAAPPDAGLVAPLGGTVEPLVHAPEAVHSTRIGGIAVVDAAILEHERAHARPFARVRRRVGSTHTRELGDRLRRRCRVHGVAGALVVVFDAAL